MGNLKTICDKVVTKVSQQKVDLLVRMHKKVKIFGIH